MVLNLPRSPVQVCYVAFVQLLAKSMLLGPIEGFTMNLVGAISVRSDALTARTHSREKCALYVRK